MAILSEDTARMFAKMGYEERARRTRGETILMQLRPHATSGGYDIIDVTDLPEESLFVMASAALAIDAMAVIAIDAREQNAGTGFTVLDAVIVEQIGEERRDGKHGMMRVRGEYSYAIVPSIAPDKWDVVPYMFGQLLLPIATLYRPTNAVVLADIFLNDIESSVR